MSRTYKATGINLKTQAFGESDRIVTILTREFGLIRATATGARKHNSSLGGRSGIFVVNELLIAKGRSIDKITQAQTIKTYPSLGGGLGKLAASQYLAEIVLAQALSEQPQDELFELFNEHLSRIQKLSSTSQDVLAYLVHGVFQLLALAGLKPQVEACCLTGIAVKPDFTNAKSLVGFSINAGGVVSMSAWENLRAIAQSATMEEQVRVEIASNVKESGGVYFSSASTSSPIYETIVHQEELPTVLRRLSAEELYLLQQLTRSQIREETAAQKNWLYIERLLRQYAQYHFGRSIRSATLIDSYFATIYG
ncbi:DNA repair protein RecO [Plectonema cf. radiosum LEGE 06105]|uniref:DNA repair protein RecO n=1 Tax=Plectonema cf. radiosum LEGE 06105 TaxID=945769 RepID=A0A8J7F0M9_9CYAN|nr:DNA repair protein RecO [Plectonema radiosum]MBE9212507.1 DNA repair protein RecO [Plectonema cf. radiosum LEGE 06105]